jgi:hypothetical protein
MNDYPVPTWRPLKIYAFDPSMGRTLNNYMTVQVPYEPLEPGPVGRKIAIIDYDISNDRYYDAVDLDHPSITINNGLEPSESDPRFHQQMVYAVASETIRHFEFALGRTIKWRRGNANDRLFGSRLRIFPHAFQQANAFYDPKVKAVLFGYFSASESDAGSNLRGQTIFTCLSHDIIAHEVTHAVLDGMRTHFSEPTSQDTPAFHEAFADIVALFQHFTIKDALIDTIRRTGGFFYRSQLTPDAAPAGRPQIAAELTPDNPLVALGQQFGEAMGMRASLRSALGTAPNSKDIELVTEPHLRGAILVAAVFDAYFTLYVKRTRDLLQIARSGGAPDAAGDLHPDLVNRLCKEAIKAANHILNICIRAIDCCPPIDIQFGEYLRAIITADSDLVPDDPWDYRGEIIKAFRLRGIIPEDVISYSEESLRWCGPVETGFPLPPCKGLEFDHVEERDEDARAMNALRAKRNARTLWHYAMGHAKSLALDPDPKNKDPNKRAPIQVYSYHPIYRIGPDGRLVIEFVVEFLQQRLERVDPDDPDSRLFKFRGGSTVIFDRAGNVRYVVRKSINSKNRLRRERDYQLGRCEASAFATYDPHGEAEPLNFAAIHRGA